MQAYIMDNYKSLFWQSRNEKLEIRKLWVFWKKITVDQATNK